MNILNITFLITFEQMDRFTAWFSDWAWPRLVGSGGSAPRFMVLEEVEGAPVPDDNGASVAFQLSFADEKGAHEWAARMLPEVLDEYRREFGTEAMAFSTLLREIPLQEKES